VDFGAQLGKPVRHGQAQARAAACDQHALAPEKIVLEHAPLPR
jgi:hypothetical protein